MSTVISRLAIATVVAVALIALGVFAARHFLATAAPGAPGKAPAVSAQASTVKPATAVAVQPSPGSAQPELLLVTRKGERAILALDFHNSRATLPSLSLAERQQYVLREALRIYNEDFADEAQKSQAIRIHALGVPNRDEYAKGSFKDLVELAVMDSLPKLLADTSLPPEQRLGQIQWKEGMTGR